MFKLTFKKAVQNTSIALNDSKALKQSIALKLANYQPKGLKADYGLPKALVGSCFATNDQLTALNFQAVHNTYNTNKGL